METEEQVEVFSIKLMRSNLKELSSFFSMLIKVT